MKFQELALAPEILEGVDNAGFEECTEVQAQAIPYVVDNRDVMVQSQTGTGKTAAFLLPIFQMLMHNERYQGTRALIVAPTRELAVQIKEESDLLAENLPVRAEVFHGGVGYHEQEKALEEGVEILVGTPGRILDLSQTGKMPLKEVSMVVIDEADRLFDMGFYPDIRRMMRRMRPREERLNMLFSATLSTRARNIAWEYMNDPVEIEIEPEQITVDRVKQELYHVASEEKMSLMLGVLKRDQPRSAIVFTNTKRMAEEIAQRLEMNGYPSEFIIGDLPQKKRLAIIRKLKGGEAEYLVATDVAARGLHVDNLGMVINFDLPEDPEAYVHRIGRTARAGESGKAISFACQRYVFGLDAIEKLINQKIPVSRAGEELYAEDQSEGRRIDRSTTRPGGNDRGGRDGRGGGRRDSRDGGRRDSRGGGRREERPRRSAESRPSTPRPPRPDSDSRGGERPARKRGGAGREKPSTPAATPSASDSLESRLAYYRQKYGEDFQPTDEMLANLEGESGDGTGSQRSGGAPRKRRRRGGRNRRRSGQDSSGAPEGARSHGEAGGGSGAGAGGERTRTPERSEAGTPAEKADSERRSEEARPKGLLGGLKRLFGRDKDR